MKKIGVYLPLGTVYELILLSTVYIAPSNKGQKERINLIRFLSLVFVYL